MLFHKSILKNDQAPWVVFLHGAGGSIETWNYQLSDFQEHFNLLLIDLRDHGRSKNISPSFDRYQFDIISNDIKLVLDQLGIQKAHFVTLSFGSVLMQDFAMRYPETIEKVVIAGGIFKGNLAIRAFVHIARFMNLFLPYEKMYGMFSYLLMPRARNQFARRLYQRQASKITQQEYMKWITLYQEFFRLLRHFYRQTIAFPALVVMGGDDYVFLKAARSFSKVRNNVQLQELKKAGHICNIEKAKSFNQLSIKFLLAA